MELSAHRMGQNARSVPTRTLRTYLVKMSESFDEVLDGVAHLLLADGLEDGEEGLEGDAALLALSLDQATNLGLGRVLAQCTDHLANLRRLEQEIGEKREIKTLPLYI